MKLTKYQTESYKRYQKFLRNWAILTATKYYEKNSKPFYKAWEETAIKMGYRKDLVRFLAKRIYNDFKGDDDRMMIFFKCLDIAYKDYENGTKRNPKRLQTPRTNQRSATE